MAISYLLAPIPKWYISDNYGRPLGAGTMYTYRQLDKQTQKFIYQDASNSNPWPDPVIFDENGSQGPFYWAVDSTDLEDTYYIEVYDRNGVLQWTIENYSPPGSGGGGGGGTVFNTIRNLITNNVMWRNIGETAVSPGVLKKLAPGAHAGFSNNVNNGNGTYTGPDIYFAKNNSSATDTVSFPLFTFGSNPFGTTDVTPESYFNYICTAAGTAETAKFVQFPITKGVENLAGQSVSVRIWGKGTGVSTAIILQFWQFFGDGTGVQSPVLSVIQTVTLTSSWVQYGPFTAIIPSVSGTHGACGNDGLFLRVYLPNDNTCDISFTKPAVYLGTSPSSDYVTYDMIDSVINVPRTGDVIVSLNNYAPFGFVAMNDGSIGSATSGATARANIDTFPLYNLIWNSVNVAWAAMADGSPRGSDAITDFTANRAMYLTKALGRVLAGTLNTEIITDITSFSSSTNIFTPSSMEGLYPDVPVRLSDSGGSLPTGFSSTVTYYVINVTGSTFQLSLSPGGAVVTASDGGSGTIFVQVTPYQLGQYLGEETHQLTISELAAHTHSIFDNNGTTTTGGVTANHLMTSALSTNSGSTGGDQPHNTLQPTTYMNFFIKL